MHRPVGGKITTVYDMASRVLSRDYRLKANSPSGTIADQDTFTYDSSSRMLTGVSGRYSNTVTNTFDNAGRLSTESLTIGGQTYTVTSEYDLRSQRKKVTYPNSSTWERTYTARRQLYETKYNGSTVDTRAYDNGGRLDTSTYANGVAADYNWRADNLLADIGFSHPVGVAANRRIGTYTYAWDANKNKTKETITGQIPGYSFDTTLGTDPDGYDDEDRLTYFKRQSTTNPQTWNLSLVGDWNSWSNFGTAQSRTHGPAHEILTAGNTPNNAFTHDVKGNMTDIPSNILSPARKLFWDFDNQLTGVDTTGDSTPEVTYEYDVLHRRVARIEGSNSKVYIHSGNQIIADYNRGTAPGTTPAFRYVWGDYIDEPILRQTGSTTILYYHRNQQYSTIALTNTSGEVVERYGYTAYGQMTVMNYLGNVRSWSDWSNRFTYTGREWDDTAKLFHFRARWYEPVAGTFVSRDPLGYVDGMSVYRAYFVPKGMDPIGVIRVDVEEEEQKVVEDVKASCSSIPRKRTCDFGGENIDWSRIGVCYRSFDWARDWIRKKRCYPSPHVLAPNGTEEALGIAMIESGCVGLTQALIGKPLLFPRDFQHCFDTLKQAQDHQQVLRDSGHCKGNKNTCGKAANPVIFGYTWNQAKCRRQIAADCAANGLPEPTWGQACPTCGCINWNDEVPNRVWIWDFGYYLDDLGLICHANRAERDGGMVEFSIPLHYEYYERHKEGHQTIYCVTCESDELKN